MTVTSYDNDPRVRKLDDYFYLVDSDSGDKYNVASEGPGTDWLITHAIGSRAMREADLRTQEEAEGWMKATSRGPFPSAEIALYELLGNPRS